MQEQMKRTKINNKKQKEKKTRKNKKTKTYKVSAFS